MPTQVCGRNFKCTLEKTPIGVIRGKLAPWNCGTRSEPLGPSEWEALYSRVMQNLVQQWQGSYPPLRKAGAAIAWGHQRPLAPENA